MHITQIQLDEYVNIMSKYKYYSQYQHPNYCQIDTEGNSHYKITLEDKVVGVFRGFKRKIMPISTLGLIKNYELIVKRALYFEDLNIYMNQFTIAIKELMKSEDLFLVSLSPAVNEEENDINIPFDLTLKDSFLRNDWHYNRPYDFSGRISYYEQTTPLNFDSLDDVFKSLKKDTKRKIKKARKVGVTVYKHQSEDLSEFYDLFKETGLRDGFEIKNLDVYENMIKTFKDRCSVFVSKLDLEVYKNHVLQNQPDRNDILEVINSVDTKEIVLGVAICLNTDYQSYYQSGATSNLFRETMHNYLLHYTAIEDAYSKGLSSYNFGGVDGSDNKDSDIYTLNMFKTRFASYRIKFVGEFYIFNSKREEFIYNYKSKK